MLLELRVENLLLIERAELRLAPGLNVLTGETGAGKTVLAHALDLLLGGRAKPGVVRPGAAEAYVEGVFELPSALRERLGERIAPDATEVVLARRVGADGRTRAYVGGRSANAGDLREIGGSLLSFFGQHEHRKLLLASAQLDVLDAACGGEQATRRAACAATHAEIRRLEAELADLRELAGARERELDLLDFELGEIEAADPRQGEHEELTVERERLRHVDALRAATLGAAEAISPDSGEGGAAAGLAGAAAALDGVAGVEASLDSVGERLRAALYEIEDAAGELRRYEESLGAPVGRLEEVEGRLEQLDRLRRKHGGTVAAVLAHAERCRERRATLADAGDALERVSGELELTRAELARAAADLHDARARAAGTLAKAVEERLAELAMAQARFEVVIAQRPEPGPRGADDVEFMIAPNPGVPAGPVREIASGGELARVMLALLGVASEGGADTLVFDEVDAGIGGRTARAVGEALRGLADGRQVLCITHLPQIASLAARHFRIAKDSGAEPARTSVELLPTDELVAEMVRMLGADVGDATARRHAEELLAAA